MDELEKLLASRGDVPPRIECPDCGHKAHHPHVCQKDYCDCPDEPDMTGAGLAFTPAKEANDGQG